MSSISGSSNDRRSKRIVKRKKIAYIGDGNNVAHSLVIAAAHAGMHVTIGTPKGYKCDPEVIQKRKNCLVDRR